MGKPVIYTVTLNPAIDRELTVAAFDFNAVLRASKTQMDWGGKGFNVSRLLMSLGMPSTAIGFVGGQTGRMLQEGLHALGIGTDFVWVPGETRTNVSIVTPAGGQYLKVNEAGQKVAPEKQQELLERVETLAVPGDWWVLAGSLPPGVPNSFYAQIVALLNQRGALSLLDTTGEALRLGCQARPVIIKPNAEETHTLTGLPVNTSAEIAQAATHLRAWGAQNVVLSLGKAGALLQTAENENWLAHSPAIQEQNPIGAGDSMVGGLIWALTQGLTLPEALPWGIASGAATASLSGTEVSTRPVIEELRAKVHLENLQSATSS
jgi:1-phosphofructokinase family hexose kinase